MTTATLDKIEQSISLQKELIARSEARLASGAFPEGSYVHTYLTATIMLAKQHITLVTGFKMNFSINTVRREMYDIAEHFWGGRDVLNDFNPEHENEIATLEDFTERLKVALEYYSDESYNDAPKYVGFVPTENEILWAYDNWKAEVL